MRFCPVDPGGIAAVVAAVGILFAVDNDAGVEEAAADCPEEGGEAAGLGLLVFPNIWGCLEYDTYG